MENQIPANHISIKNYIIEKLRDEEQFTQENYNQILGTALNKNDRKNLMLRFGNYVLKYSQEYIGLYQDYFDQNYI